MCAKQVKKTPTEVGTTGHSWDGIEEYNNPLPRWWVWCLYLTIAWGLWYSVAYPAWPMLTQATQGYLGADMRQDVAAEIKLFDDANAEIKATLVAAPLASIPADDTLNQYANSAGAAVFKTWCAQCHGSGAGGVQGKGYPNLTDNDWLWGGDMESLHATITHGIRNTTDADARYSQMPNFGTDELLDANQIAQVTEYVLQISKQDGADTALATAGATVFAENCVACHGDMGQGDKTQGAPALNDAIWLYGGDRATITQSISVARFGVMPAWADRLSEDEIRAVSSYVHNLGGGE